MGVACIDETDRVAYIVDLYYERTCSGRSIKWQKAGLHTWLFVIQLVLDAYTGHAKAVGSLFFLGFVAVESCLEKSVRLFKACFRVAGAEHCRQGCQEQESYE